MPPAFSILFRSSLLFGLWSSERGIAVKREKSVPLEVPFTAIDIRLDAQFTGVFARNHVLKLNYQC